MGRSKYGNVRTYVDGIAFASKREAKRWGELQLMLRAGLIANLERQPSYSLEVCGRIVCRYVGDFRYTERGAVVVEDAKGVRTDVYKLKKKMMQAQYGIEIQEV